MSSFKGILALVGLMAIMIVMLHQAVPKGQHTPTRLVIRAITGADREAALGRAGDVDRPATVTLVHDTSPVGTVIARAGQPCERVIAAAPAPEGGSLYRITCLGASGSNSERSYLVDTYKGTATAL